jgi:hypothetical protein
MANRNFVVHNGLTVGAFTVDATTGDITTSGNLTVLGTTTTAQETVTIAEVNAGNLTVAGSIVVGNYPVVLDDIIVRALGDVSAQNVYHLKLNGVSINNTYDVVASKDFDVFVDGIRQRPLIRDISPTLPWLEYSIATSNLNRSFRVVNSGALKGNLVLYNVPLPGVTISTVLRSKSSGEQTIGSTTKFSGLTIALGD